MWCDNFVYKTKKKIVFAAGNTLMVKPSGLENKNKKST